jgi:hypothetical protein
MREHMISSRLTSTLELVDSSTLSRNMSFGDFQLNSILSFRHPFPCTVPSSCHRISPHC